MLYEIVPNNTLKPLVLASALALAMVSAPALAGKANLSGLSSSQTFDRFIVKYRSVSAESRDARARERSLNLSAGALQVRGATPGAKARAVGLRHLRRMALGADVVRTDRKLDRLNAETLMRRLALDPSVEYVEVDRRVYPAFVPNDTRYAEQWHYSAANGINMPNAWDQSTGNGVVVAVLDSGITPHIDLQGQTVAGYDFIDTLSVANDGNGRDANPADPGDWTVAGDCNDPQWPGYDSTWHGTQVAGLVAAATNNATGVSGVAYGARVQPVRVLGRCGGYESDIVDAIIWSSGGAVAGVPANATPAKVLNLSLNSPGVCGETYQNAIDSAVVRGATVVVAAGNNGQDASLYNPANCRNVVAVGASGRDGRRATHPWWSSNHSAAVDIAAPGLEVLTTVNSGARAQGVDTYVFSQGTSMATPQVAGVVALMQSARGANRLLTPAQVERILKDTARAFPNGVDRPLGAGIVDANAAVRAAIAFGVPVPVPPVPSQLLLNPGFESGQVNWIWTNTDYSIAIYNNPARARTGNYLAWLNGRGRVHTSTLSQSVNIPAGRASATLNFHLRIETAETVRTAYDRLTVQVLNASGRVLNTCATYSNLEANAGYAQKTCDLSPYIGQTVTIKFTGTEDESLKTGFLIDDVSLDVR